MKISPFEVEEEVPITEIPLSELVKEDPRIVDCIGMLGVALQQPNIMVRNGILWVEQGADGRVILSPEIALELFKLARTYRSFWRIYQLKKLVQHGKLSFQEWNRFFMGSCAACHNLDKVKKDD